jgi:predicted RNase H-like HicB family nuclease
MRRAKPLRNTNFSIVLQEEPEGGYTVTVPSLPGCVTYGRTVPEARKMAEEAIELYVETLTSIGWLKERDLLKSQALMTSVNVRVAS